MSHLKSFLWGRAAKPSLRDLTPENYWAALRTGRSDGLAEEEEAFGRAVADKYGVNTESAGRLGELASKLSPEVPKKVTVAKEEPSDPDARGQFAPSWLGGGGRISIKPGLNPWTEMGTLYHESRHAQEGRGNSKRNDQSDSYGSPDLATMDARVSGHFQRHRNLDYDFPMGELALQQVLMGQRIAPSMRERVKSDLPLNESALPLRGRDELGDIEDVVLKLLGERK